MTAMTEEPELAALIDEVRVGRQGALEKMDQATSGAPEVIRAALVHVGKK